MCAKQVTDDHYRLRRTPLAIFQVVHLVSEMFTLTEVTRLTIAKGKACGTCLHGC